MSDEVKKIANKLIDEMPKPQDHVTENESKEQVTAPAPEIETDDKGNPILNKDGTPRKKRGRKKGVNYSIVGKASRQSASVANPGRAIAETIFVAGMAIGGDEWAPQTDAETGRDERATMIEAWDSYCEAKGLDDVPPGMAVTIAMLSYMAPRFTMPKTKNRLQKAKDWLTLKYLKIRYGVTPEKPAPEKAETA